MKIPELPRMIQKCTASVKLRAVCLDSTEDIRHLLCRELREWFGFACEGVAVSRLPVQNVGESVKVVSVETLPSAVQDADLLVTTRLHAHQVRPVAEVLGKPLVVVSIHPITAETLLERLRKGPLIVVCVDPYFGDRMRVLAGSEYQDRIRVVLAKEEKAVSELDLDEPVFITHAAMAQLDRHPPSLITGVPAFSPESAAELSFLLVRLNMEGAPTSE